MQDVKSRILDYAVAFTWERMACGYAPDSCIAGTSILIAAAAEFGISLAPLPVSVICWCPKGAELLQRLERFPTTTEVDEAGAHCVGIGNPPGAVRQNNAGMWSGHLVAVGHGLICDTTLQQASRPEKDLLLQPSLVEVERSWIDDWHKLGLFVSCLCNGSLVQYAPDVPNSDWSDSPDWTRKRCQRPFVEAVCYDVRRAMENFGGAR